MSDNKKNVQKSKLTFPLPSQDTNLYLNRELSLLEFNRRVIVQAEDESLPILERLRYLCIGSSNLDEFFEVRISSQLAHHTPEAKVSSKSILHQISQRCHELVDLQYKLLNNQILPKLTENGIYLMRHKDWTDKQRAWAKKYFEEQVLPALTPIVLDPAHPFPKTANKSLHFIISLAGKDVFGRGSAIAILKAPRILPRTIKMPDEIMDDGIGICLLSSIIIDNIQSLFPEREVLAYAQFRITRDSDLWVDEDEVKNLRQALKSSLKSRHFGTAIRLEVSSDCPDHLVKYLMNEFKIEKDYVYPVKGPVNLARLNQMFKYITNPKFYFDPYLASIHPDAMKEGTLFDTLKKKDILLHHPYQSFRTVIDFIRSAADDPNVVVIKQTVYRVSEDSELMQALIDAANRGKEVIVIVELKARFDEERNIDWAQQLEKAGAQVVYGVMGLKTHAKLALVIRRENSEFHYYAHLGTGNYHSITSKLYTDFGLLTANPKIAEEVNDVFFHLTSLTKPRKMENLWLAPFTLHRNIIRNILNEIRIARQGRPAHIIAKMNSLIEESVIRALYLASSAGVKIDLIVRGACSLRPGIPGLSENIRVRSIIGRFLEHERIYYFRNDMKQTLYLSSADWMGRNLFRRIEVAFPILDPTLKRRVIEEGLRYYLKDNTNSWELHENGTYRKRRLHRKQNPFCAQQYLASLYDANIHEPPATDTSDAPNDDPFDFNTDITPEKPSSLPISEEARKPQIPTKITPSKIRSRKAAPIIPPVEIDISAKKMSIVSETTTPSDTLPLETEATTDSTTMAHKNMPLS